MITKIIITAIASFSPIVNLDLFFLGLIAYRYGLY